MNNEQIVNQVLEKMHKLGFGFTTKNDPTFQDADEYIELDEYGDLTDKSIKQIAEEVIDYIGDGAIDVDDAIDLWLDENLAKNTVAYVEVLRTKFKPKPVVDNIEAYENPVQHDVKTESRILKAKSLREESGLLTKIPANLKVQKPMSEFTDDMWAKYFDEYVASRQEMYEDGSDYNLAFLRAESQRMGLDGQFTETSYKDDIENMAVEYANKKEKQYNDVRAEYNKQFESLTEGKLTRLKEENNTSANIISAKFTDKDFDSDSKDGQIVMKTSELFNVLSDKGYDVQVSFDNGESQSVILLGDQGGRVVITITDPNKPLRAFASGNFELTTDILDKFSNIVEDIDVI